MNVNVNVQFVLQFIILGFFVTQIAMKPTPKTDEDKIELKLPKRIEEKTNIMIIGNNNHFGNFSATLYYGDHMDEENSCEIFFAPQQNYFKIIQRVQKFESSDTSYTFITSKENKDHVSFKLSINITRRMDSEEPQVDILFDANNGGEAYLGNCIFKFNKIFEYIKFKGVQHVKTLTFDFEHPNEIQITDIKNRKRRK